MCAPKGPGHIVPASTPRGSGVPDPSVRDPGCHGDVGYRAVLRPGAWAVRAGVIKATFAPGDRGGPLGEQAVPAAAWWSW